MYEILQVRDLTVRHDAVEHRRFLTGVHTDRMHTRDTTVQLLQDGIRNLRRLRRDDPDRLRVMHAFHQAVRHLRHDINRDDRIQRMDAAERTDTDGDDPPVDDLENLWDAVLRKRNMQERCQDICAAGRRLSDQDQTEAEPRKNTAEYSCQQQITIWNQTDTRQQPEEKGQHRRTIQGPADKLHAEKLPRRKKQRDVEQCITEPQRHPDPAPQDDAKTRHATDDQLIRIIDIFTANRHQQRAQRNQHIIPHRCSFHQHIQSSQLYKSAFIIA